MFSLVERWRLAVLQLAISRGRYRDDEASPELNRLRFYRWLVHTGRMSDTPAPAPAQDEAPAPVAENAERGSP
jgi:hypothetical protein